MDKYNFSKIEAKWQKKWQDTDAYKTSEATDKSKCYVLDMFPYPSGVGLHVGHPKGYIATDVYSRFKTLNNFNVLHPMGWDAFGLPAENFAIKNKVHPRAAVEANIDTYKKQLQKIGFSYDWEREIDTTDPDYYKWTQWIFLKMFEKGLAYESFEPIIWCPSCQTGLAQEDLENGVCERCGSEVERKPMRQWVLKIVEYADRLLEDLKLVDWEKQIIDQQINWIGRKEGININYEIENFDDKITVFTTRPDTNFGATFIVAAPDCDFITNNIDKFPQAESVKKYVETALKKTELDRIKEGRNKTGVFTGLYAVNTLNNEKMPIYVGDFVLANFGTGIVVGVPGHDLRDFEFAQSMGLKIKRVVVGPDGDDSDITKSEQVQESAGTMVNSDFLNGLDIHEAIKKMMDYMEEKNMGQRVVNYRLNDWVFARQRYWGEPIPIIHCDNCGVVPVPEDQLPVKLPDVKNYEPSGTGESPLAKITDWVNVDCPKCGGKGKRETNTMPQWAGSSWYYLRYIDPNNNKALVDPDKEKYWMNVDLYVGGAEHATRHLIYARFWHKFLYDIGVVSTLEPFQRLHHVGLILAEDGRKMSKRWNNVINPDEVVAEYGADALRIYEMFIGPFDQAAAWNTNGLDGISRFLQKIWRLYNEKDIINESSESQSRAINKVIKKVSADIESFDFNTAISAMMIFVNEVSKDVGISQEVLEKFAVILAPFAPHLAEELWQKLGKTESILKTNWPSYDEKLMESGLITYIIQVNGKMRDKIEVEADKNEAEVKAMAIELEKVKKFIDGKDIKKEIVVPNKLINFVV